MGGKVYLKRDAKKKSTSYFGYFLWAAIGLVFLVVVTPLLTHRRAEKSAVEKVTPEKGMVMKEIPRSMPYENGKNELPGDSSSDQGIKETNLESNSTTATSIPSTTPESHASIPAEGSPQAGGPSVPLQNLSDQGQSTSMTEHQQRPIQTSTAADNAQSRPQATNLNETVAAPAILPESASPKQSTPVQTSTSSKPQIAASSAKTPVTGSTKYVVQIGSFSQKENADGIQQELLKKGYEVLVRTINHAKFGRLYVVQLAPVYDSTKAQSLVTKVKQEANVKPMVIKVPTDQ